MLRGYLFTATPARRDWVQRLLLETGSVTVHQAYDRYPNAQDLRHLGRQFEPEVVLLDFSDPNEAQRVRATVAEAWSSTAWVPLSPQLPESPARLEAALYEAVHARPLAKGARVVAFVPAKAGCGASTLAWNVAHACPGRCLLLEADLRSGVLSFVWNQTLTGSVQAALKMAAVRDEHALLQSVMNHGRLDLLLSSRAAMNPPPEWAAWLILLETLRPRYDFIFVDLPELINPGTAELARAAETVLVVTTPELLSLKLAEHRCKEIEEWGVPGTRVKLALNRAQKNELTARDVEQNLCRPVAASFPNDYHAVRKSVLAAGPVREDSALGEAVRAFVAGLTPGVSSGGAAAGLMGLLRRFAGSGEVSSTETVRR